MNTQKYNRAMKGIIRLLILLTILVCGNASAQTGMHINNVLGGKYVSDPSVTEVIMSGEQKFVKAHGLSNLATFRGDSETYAPILQPLVLADGAKSIGRNVRYRDGKLQYAFFMLPVTIVNGKKTNRYLYYLNNPDGNKPSVMMIYFDGTLSRTDAEAVISKLSSLNEN